MKSYLIIPMGGSGSRFIKAGYKTYKVFLKIDQLNTILDKIISNFNGIDLEVIILGNNKLFNRYKYYLNKKNIHFISIKKHQKGPVYSIYLGLSKIKKIIKKNKNIFISYSDINWSWNIKEVYKKLKNKNLAVFTHTNFHPHLESNSKSDFCKIKKNNIIKIIEKKTFSNDYKKDFLAIGCYYIKDVSYLNFFFQKVKKQFLNKKETYLVSLINFYLRKKIKIFNYKIDKFVHLGIPSQYEDYLKWKDFFLRKKNNIKLKNISSIMLMAGKGKRMKSLNIAKPFLPFEGKPMYKYIFDYYKSKEKQIITNSIFKNRLKKFDYKLNIIKNSNSMFETINLSRKLLTEMNDYFLTSCDCMGNFDKKNIKKLIEAKNLDLVLFAFKFSDLQKKLGNAHTQLVLKRKKLKDIRVKKYYKNGLYGHAGMFWIKNGKIFNYLDEFKLSKYYLNMKREILIDDYFKYLVNRKKINISYFLLKNYIHIGSIKEYQEYLYWKHYFKNDR